MKTLKFISLLLSIALLSSIAKANSSAFFSGGGKEVIFFMSFDCGACYESSLLVSAWSEINKDVDVKYIPIFNRKPWRASARLYFLVELTKSNHLITRSKRLSTVFSLARQEALLDDKQYMMTLLKKYGMEFTVYEFSQLWNASTIMMHSATEITNSINIDHAEVPFIRISNKEDASYFIKATDVEVMLKALNKEFS
jgi:hypothetical protein